MSGFLVDVAANNAAAQARATEQVAAQQRLRLDETRGTTQQTRETTEASTQQQAFQPRLVSGATEDALSRLAFEQQQQTQDVAARQAEITQSQSQPASAETGDSAAVTDQAASSGASQVAESANGSGEASTDSNSSARDSLEDLAAQRGGGSVTDNISREAEIGILTQAAERARTQFLDSVGPQLGQLVPNLPGAADIQLNVFDNPVGDNDVRAEVNAEQVQADIAIELRNNEEFEQVLNEQEAQDLEQEREFRDDQLEDQRDAEERDREAYFEDRERIAAANDAYERQLDASRRIDEAIRDAEDLAVDLSG